MWEGVWNNLRNCAERVDTVDGLQRTDLEVHLISGAPDPRTRTALLAHPLFRYVTAVLARKVDNQEGLLLAQSVTSARLLLLSEVTPPAFSAWNEGKPGMETWISKYYPPFMRNSKPAKEAAGVMLEALMKLRNVADVDKNVGSVTVAMLVGLSAEVFLKTQGMAAAQNFGDLVEDAYAGYEKEFAMHATNENLLHACEQKWGKQQMQQMEEESGRGCVPMPTMMGLHLCNSLIVEGYLSTLYTQGIVGSIGLVIRRLLAYWIVEDKENLLTNKERYSQWLSVKLARLTADLAEAGLQYAWTTRVHVENAEVLKAAWFFPGRGPPANVAVKVLNFELMTRFYELVYRGQADGRYVVGTMFGQYKLADGRCGERDGRLEKSVVNIDNAQEMLKDKTDLQASVDLVLKGLAPTAAAVRTYKAEAACILTMLGNPSGALVAESIQTKQVQFAWSSQAPERAEVLLAEKRGMVLQFRGGDGEWGIQHDSQLVRTVIQVVGKRMDGFEKLPKKTLQKCLEALLGKKLPTRKTKEDLQTAVQSEYENRGEDDGSKTVLGAFNCAEWHQVWMHEDAPLSLSLLVETSGSGRRKRKAASGEDGQPGVCCERGVCTWRVVGT